MLVVVHHILIGKPVQKRLKIKLEKYDQTLCKAAQAANRLDSVAADLLSLLGLVHPIHHLASGFVALDQLA